MISGFGVVAHLHDTADNTLVPQTVRDYIVREMVKRGFGSKLQPGFENMQPEDMMRTATVAVVRVDGYIPPGAEKAIALIYRSPRYPARTPPAWRRRALSHGIEG